MELRQKIRERRTKLRITQKALAMQLGVHYNTINRFEAGTGSVSHDVLLRVCAALGLRLTVEVVQEEVMRESA